MAINTRRALFATNRGRIAKRGTVVLIALAVGMSILSNATGGKAETVEEEAAGIITYVVPVEPVVAAFIADPFAAETASYYETGSATPPAAATEYDPATGLPVKEAVPTQGDNEAVTIRQLAQQFAVAWSTYSGSQDATTFAGSLPNVSPDAAAALNANAAAQWAAMVEGDVISVGTLTGENPQVEVYDASSGSATVAVAVSKSISKGSAAPKVSEVTLVIDLNRFTIPATDAVDAATAWGVSAVTTR